MSGDVPLFRMTRAGDPDTSQDAAASVDVRRSQAQVLRVLAELGPSTDEQLVDFFTQSANCGGPYRMSPSGVRSRRAELVRLGLVQWTGQRACMHTGRMARVWEAVRE